MSYAVRTLKLKIPSSICRTDHGYIFSMSLVFLDKVLVTGISRWRGIHQWTWISIDLIYQTSEALEMMRKIAADFNAAEAFLIHSHTGEALDLLERNRDGLERSKADGKPDPRPPTEDPPERIVRV